MKVKLEIIHFILTMLTLLIKNIFNKMDLISEWTGHFFASCWIFYILFIYFSWNSFSVHSFVCLTISFSQYFWLILTPIFVKTSRIFASNVTLFQTTTEVGCADHWQGANIGLSFCLLNFKQLFIVTNIYVCAMRQCFLCLLINAVTKQKGKVNEHLKHITEDVHNHLTSIYWQHLNI